MFFEQKGVNFSAYADDSTPFFFVRKTFVRKVLLSRFKIRALKLLEYFSINYMKKCSDKYHFILSSNDENKEENLT